MYVKIEQTTIQEKDYKVEMFSILSEAGIVNMNFKVSQGKVSVTSNK